MKKQKKSFLTIAQQHYKRGFYLIPTKGKIPLIKKWQQNCIKKPSKAKFMQDMSLLTNSFGLPCGPASNIIGVDIDTNDKELLRIINKIIPPSPITKVGKIGETRLYRYNGEESCEIKAEGKHIMDILSTNRQMIIPPSIHPETRKPYRYLNKNTLLNYDLEKLPILPKNSIKKLKQLLSDKQLSSKDTNLSQGRNDQLKSMAVAMLSKGKEEDEIIRELINYDQREHEPPLFEDKNENVYKSKDPYKNALYFLKNIKKSLTKEQTSDNFLNILSLKEYFKPNRFPEPIPIIKNLINKQELHICSAPAKTGKTLLQLNLALSVARGEPFLGHFQTVKSRVLILQTEVSPINFLKRLKQLTNENIKDIGLSIFISNKRIKLNNENELTILKNTIKRYKPDLVILDPFYTLHNLNEDSSTEMGPLLASLMEIIQQSDAACLLIHHQGKNPNGHRGSSSLSDAPDGNWSLSKTKNPKEAKLSFELRNYESPPTLDLYLHEDLKWQSQGLTIIEDKNLSIDTIVTFVKNQPGIRRQELIDSLSKEFNLSERTIVSKIQKTLGNQLIYKDKIKGIRGHCYYIQHECNDELS